MSGVSSRSLSFALNFGTVSVYLDRSMSTAVQELPASVDLTTPPATVAYSTLEAFEFGLVSKLIKLFTRHSSLVLNRCHVSPPSLDRWMPVMPPV